MARRVPTAIGTYVRVTCPWSAHAAVDSTKISGNRGVHQGQMVGFKVVAANVFNAITFTLSIKDGDGDIIYTSGALAENATTLTMGLNIPLIEQEKIVIDASGNPGNDVDGQRTDLTVDVVLYYNPDADQIAWGYRG